jgi:hypothetical protein
MKRTTTSTDHSTLVNLDHARWLIGVLGMLIAVLGKESLLGLILGQTRQEIGSLVRAEQEDMVRDRDRWHLNN